MGRGAQSSGCETMKDNYEARSKFGESSRLTSRRPCRASLEIDRPPNNHVTVELMHKSRRCAVRHCRRGAGIAGVSVLAVRRQDVSAPARISRRRPSGIAHTAKAAPTNLRSMPKRCDFSPRANPWWRPFRARQSARALASRSWRIFVWRRLRRASPPISSSWAFTRALASASPCRGSSAHRRRR